MTPRSMMALSLVVLVVFAGCRESPPAASQRPGTEQGPAGTPDLNACHLLTHEDVSTLVERRVTMADQTEAGDTWSTCDWEDADGTFAFGLTVYWSDGKQQWDMWRVAQGLGGEMLKRAEGVAVDSVVRQGLVPDIGDGAYFSELLPSLVLKGDVLFEMKLALVPKADTKFAALARKLLAKVP